MPGEKKTIVLISGGVDSVSALYHVAAEFEVLAGLSFDYGSKHNHKEIPLAAYHCDHLHVPHHVINLDFMDEHFDSRLLRSGGSIPEGRYEDDSMRQTVVPFRNGIMLSIAAGLAESLGAQSVIIAAHAGDHAVYPDCRKDFMAAMADAVRLGTNAGIELISPFISMTKAEIIVRGHELGVDFSKTWSCYKGGGVHCGKCGTCIERREAFQQAGVNDPTKYEQSVC